jgi:hypothetical protein
MPSWVKTLLDEWLQAANPAAGKLFWPVNKNGKTWGDGLTEKAVWHVVREHAHNAGIERLAPHDLRRTCARLCHSVGGELEQIRFFSCTSPSKRPNVIWAAISTFAAPSTIASASNRNAESRSSSPSCRRYGQPAPRRAR